jgi:hypothetical protein
VLTAILTRLRGILQRRRVAREVEDELQFHVSMETESNLKQGMSPIDARRAAMLDIGGVEQTKQIRDVRALSIEGIWWDARYAFRVMRKRPGFTVLVSATLALGIGVNTTSIAVAYGILVRPLPYAGPSRVVILNLLFANGGDLGFSPAALQDRLPRLRTVERRRDGERGLTLTTEGCDLLHSHSLERDAEPAQVFYAGASRSREIDHDSNLYATFRQADTSKARQRLVEMSKRWRKTAVATPDGSNRAEERSQVERRRRIVTRLRWLEGPLTAAEIVEDLRNETPPIVVSLRTVERDFRTIKENIRRYVSANEFDAPLEVATALARFEILARTGTKRALAGNSDAAR